MNSVHACMCNLLILQQGVLAGADGVQINLDTLEQVQIIFRHGLRSPEKPYPGDPYNEDKFWPQGWGMLTNERKGSDSKFNALSSDSDRAIMSLLANLAGLFPPQPKDKWSEDFHTWQPIPFRTIPKPVDRIIRGSAPCSRFDGLWSDLLETEEFREANGKFKELYEYINNHTGQSYSYPVDLTTFYEALIIQEAHGFNLPDWTKKIYPSEMSTNLLNFAFSLVVRTEEMKRLRGGPLLKELLSNMDLKVRKDFLAKKMILYSGHDITLVRIMDTMNLFNPPHLPDFNSVLFIELHKSNSGHYIETYYRNGLANLTKLTVEGCPDICYLQDFKNLLQSRILSDSESGEECSVEVHEAQNFAVKAVSFWGNIYTYALRWLI
ncbi:unnamed protein product [Allacma fusca]|uniref:acid phosphatase n=1 Tax=Allacma fusca TaxID=39272 RepID=A0A8J2P0D6_9HEXA|nr:unnamed protein product [Allacma fusca]